MVELIASSLAAGLHIILFSTFSLVLALIRAGTGIHYGNGGSGKKDLFPLVRAQGNIAEFGPYIILAIFFTEYNELLAPTTLTTVAILSFVIRLLHGVRLANPETVPLLFRVVGIFGTVGILFWLAGLNVFFGLYGKK